MPLRNQLLLGHAAEALPEVRESTPGTTPSCSTSWRRGASPGWRVRTAQQAGLAAADSRLAWEDNQAEYRLSQGLAQAGSLLTNDQTPALPGARLRAHHAAPLSGAQLLAAGDADGALVEVRRANQVQEQALKRRADEVQGRAGGEQEDEAGEMRQLMSRGAPSSIA